MVPGEQAEDAIVADVGNVKEGEVRAMGIEDDPEQQHDGKFSMKNLLWHGGSVWDAWFSCASNQVCAFTRAVAAVCQDMHDAFHGPPVAAGTLKSNGAF